MSIKKLRIFGFALTILLVFIGFFFNYNLFFVISFFNFIITIFYPLLYIKFKIYQFIETLGKSIQKVNSFLIILFIFFFIFTPISIILKIFKIDLLDKKINKSVSTYFKNRTIQPNSLKKQF